MIPTAALDPHHGVGSQPIMSVDHVEAPIPILLLEEMPDKGPAHILNFINKVPIGLKGTVMIPNSVNLKGSTGPVAWPGKNVDDVSLALESCRQFGYVGRDSTHCDRMERFPREHRYAHNAYLQLPEPRRCCLDLVATPQFVPHQIS